MGGAGSLCRVKNNLGKVPLEVAKKEYTKEFLVAYERAYKKYLVEHPEVLLKTSSKPDAADSPSANKPHKSRLMQATHQQRKRRKSTKVKINKSAEDEAAKAREALKFPLLNYHIYAEQWKVSVAAQIGDIDFLRE